MGSFHVVLYLITLGILGYALQSSYLWDQKEVTQIWE